MLGKIYNYSTEETKNIEKLIDDDNVNIIHMVFPKGDRLATHFSNSNVYMIVIKGVLSIRLDEQDEHKYNKGEILNIPYKTKMNVYNSDDEVLEIFVVKSPNPKNYKEK